MVLLTPGSSGVTGSKNVTSKCAKGQSSFAGNSGLKMIEPSPTRKARVTPASVMALKVTMLPEVSMNLSKKLFGASMSNQIPTPVWPPSFTLMPKAFSVDVVKSMVAPLIWALRPTLPTAAAE